MDAFEADRREQFRQGYVVRDHQRRPSGNPLAGAVDIPAGCAAESSPAAVAAIAVVAALAFAGYAVWRRRDGPESPIEVEYERADSD